MTSLSVKLRSALVGLIKPLHKPSVKLTNLTNSITYEFACELYHELQSGPPQISQDFLKDIASSTAFVNGDQQALKRAIDSFHNQLLNDTKSKIMIVKPAFDTWSQAVEKSYPNLGQFLYYLIVSKEQCENIKISREEAKTLSEIFFTLSENYPQASLEIMLPDTAPVIIYNAPSTFKRLSCSFRELADKKLTDSNAKLSLKSIIVSN